MDSLQDFYRLAAGDQKTRVAAVASLGRSLPPSPAGPFCGLEQLDKNLSYALRRLAKGLASSRQSARLGFTLALAQSREALDALLDLIVKHTSLAAIGGGKKAADVNDTLFGKLFGVFAIILSEALLGLEKAKESEAEALPLEDRLIEILTSLPLKKHFLQESTAWVLGKLLQQRQDLFEPALLKVFPPGEDNSNDLDGLSPSQRHSLSPSKDDSDLCNKWTLLCSRISDPQVLVQVIKESVVSSHPRLHRIWDLILAPVSSSDSQASFAGINPGDFFKHILDEGLFRSTHMCKYAGFLAFSRILTGRSSSEEEESKDPEATSTVTGCSAQTFSLLLQPTLVRCLITSLASPATFLHKIAKKTAKTLVASVTSRSDLAVVAALQLPQNFDSLTRTRLVADAISALDGPQLSKFLAHLLDDQEKAPASEMTRSQISRILARPSASAKLLQSNETDIVDRSLRFLASTSTTATTDAFFSALEGVQKGIPLRTEGARNWIEEATSYISSPKIPSGTPETLALLIRLMSLHDTLHSSTEFTALAEEAASIASPGKRKHNDDQDSSDVLLDLLLSLFLNDTAAGAASRRLIREAAMRVVEEIVAPGVSVRGVQVLADVLETREARGDGGVLEDGDDGQDSDTMDEDEADDDEDDDNNAEEMQKIFAAAKAANAVDASSTAAGSDNDDDDALGDDDMAPFDEKLAEIFREKKRIATEAKASKLIVSHFKIRCVGILEVLWKKSALNNHPNVAVEILSRLVGLLLKTAPANTGSSKGQQIELHNKLLGIANKIPKAKIVFDSKDVNVEAGITALREMHETIGKVAPNSALVNTCSGLSLFLVKILSGAPTITENKAKKSKKSKKTPVEEVSLPKQICDIYLASLQQLLKQKRTRFTVKFFADFSARYPVLAFENLSLPLSQMMNLEQVFGAFQVVEAVRIGKSIMTSIPADYITQHREEIDKTLALLVDSIAKIVVQLGEKDRKRLKECLNDYWEIVACKRLDPHPSCVKIIGELEKLESLESTSAIGKITKRLKAKYE